MSEQAKAVPPTIGKIIPLDEPAYRDAIHIAIAPCIAGEELWAGVEVGFTADDHITVGRNHDDNGNDRAGWKPIGIVDPYLKNGCYPGQRIWVFLFPNTVTSLRHQWTHPDFPDEQAATQPAEAIKKETNASEKWMRDFAYEIGTDYDTAVQAGLDVISGGYGHTFPYDTPAAVHNHKDEYWKHLRIITGVKMTAEDGRNAPFSCSC